MYRLKQLGWGPPEEVRSATVISQCCNFLLGWPLVNVTLPQPTYLGIRFHFPPPCLRSLAGGAGSPAVVGGWGGGSQQPRGWSKAPHPRVPGPLLHPPAPWAGLRGPPWLGVLPPTPGPGPLLRSSGVWALGRGGFFCFLSLSLSPSGSPQPVRSFMFPGCQQIATEDEFLSPERKKIFLVRPVGSQPAPGEPLTQECPASSASVFLFLLLGSPLACQGQNRRAIEQSRGL